MLNPWKKSYDQPKWLIKKQRDYLANKGLSSQGYGFSNSHVWMWELDYKESWAQKNWSFRTVVWEKTLESPLDCEEIQQVHPKGYSWMFIGRIDVEAETPVLWLPDVKSWLIWKDPDAGKDCGQKEKGTTEDEMVGWHHRLDGHEFGWTLGVGDEQRGLACCGSWGLKESDTTEWLNWTEQTKRGPPSTALTPFSQLLPSTERLRVCVGTVLLFTPQSTQPSPQEVYFQVHKHTTCWRPSGLRFAGPLPFLRLSPLKELLGWGPHLQVCPDGLSFV